MLRDPCGIICIGITYFAVFYADYVVSRWICLNSFEGSIWGWVHVLLFNVVVLVLLTSHMKAVWTDPGGVPSNLEGGTGWTMCSRCDSFRPPRAHHCRICRKCVKRMDHHCPWINNCVGERNQGYFMQFLLYVGVLSVYSVGLIIYSWIQRDDRHHTDDDFLAQQSFMLHSVLLMLESMLFGLFVLAIMIDQLRAVLSDETMVEQVQSRSKRDKSAYRPKNKRILMSRVCGGEDLTQWVLPCPTKNFYDDDGRDSHLDV